MLIFLRLDFFTAQKEVFVKFFLSIFFLSKMLNFFVKGRVNIEKEECQDFQCILKWN